MDMVSGSPGERKVNCFFLNAALLMSSTVRT
jgi:hypothetical protein